ncbi:amidase, partial [Bordetella pertussis]
MGWESICAMTALQLRAELAAGHLSAREILQAHLEAIEHWNPTVNAIVTLDVEGARRRAAAADQAQ